MSNVITGFFGNANTMYYLAPQLLNKGTIQGHCHVVAQKLSDAGDSTVLDPTSFQFFKGINTAAKPGTNVELFSVLTFTLTYLSCVDYQRNHRSRYICGARTVPILFHYRKQYTPTHTLANLEPRACRWLYSAACCKHHRKCACTGWPEKGFGPICYCKDWFCY